MGYGYVITCEDAEGREFTVSDGGFDSRDEARAEAEDHWLAIEEDGDGAYPVDLQVYEN